MNKLPPNFLSGTKQPTDGNFLPIGSHPFGSYSPHGVFPTDSHNNLIRAKGFKATHYRHALNPDRETVVGGVNLENPPDANVFKLYDPRTLYIVPQQMNWSDQYVLYGVYGSHTVGAVNFTGYYEDEPHTRVYLSKHDVLVIEDSVTVQVREIFEYKPTGPARLKFPIVNVDHLSDKNDKRYEADRDFTIVDGMIEWTGSDKPTWDTKNSRGEVLSIVYWTKPVYSVMETPRVFRMVHSNATGDDRLPSDATYMSGSAVVRMLWLDNVGNLLIPGWPNHTEAKRSHNSRA
jgi:hypothetical protein